MKHDMIARCRSLLNDRRAVTAIEYAMIAGLLSILIVIAVISIGHTTSTQFHTVSVSV